MTPFEDRGRRRYRRAAAIPTIAAALLVPALAAMLAFPAAAAGHALLKGSEPAGGATLGSAPAAVTLHFTEAPDIRLTSVKVLDSNGTDWTDGPLEAVSGDAESASQPVRELPDGGYTVTWRAVSSVDGHVSAGSFVFGVGVPPPTAAPDQPAAEADVSGSPSAIGARWLLYLGLVALFGAAWAALVVARTSTAGLVTMAVGGWLLTSLGTVAVVAVQWTESGAPIETVLTTSLGAGALARAISLLVVGAALAGLAVVPTLAGRRGWALVSLAAAGALTVDVLLGHAAAGSGWLLQVTAQAAHAIAAAGWIGGLAGLLVLLRAAAPEDRWTLARRFSRWAGVLLAIVAVTGALRAVVELGSLDALTGSDFGLAVIAKSALLFVLAGLGAFNHFVTLRTAERVGRWLRRLGAAEVSLGVIVLALSALLVNLSPPVYGGVATPPATQPLIVVAHDFGTSIRARLVVTDGVPGSNRFDLAVTDYDTGEPVEAPAAELRFDVESVAGVASTTLDLIPGDAGRFGASGPQLSIDGIWTVTATVTMPGGAVAVPLVVATVVPAQPVTELVTAGLPTIYTVSLGAAGTAQVYLDPGGAGPNQLHATFFDAAGTERPLETFTVAVTTADGASQLLAPHLLEPGHFVAPIDAAAGPLSVDVVTGDPTVADASHIHLHVTIEVQP